MLQAFIASLIPFGVMGLIIYFVLKHKEQKAAEGTAPEDIVEE
jgi:preprotein translocase subunit YajC